MTAPVTAEGISLARAHLVGVGGAGMSGIARILVDRGLPVAGSDIRDSAALTALVERGVRVAVGHDAAHLDLLSGGPTAVVVSTAVRPDNPEVRAALERGIPVVRRADALAALMAGHRAVCVAGTHGKTSTTSMLAVALQHAGVDPSFAIGGELAGSGVGAHHGSGDIFVAEADESDGSFLSFTPHGAVVTNLEPDHLDHHGTAEAYTAVFDQFTERIEPGGFLVVGADDPGSAALASRSRLGRVISYGVHPAAGVRIGQIRAAPSPAGSGSGALTGAEVILADGREVSVRLTVPGEHMVFNAVAALATGVELGLDPALLADGLATYVGVRRRFEFRGEAGGVRVYDDYAHHPTEVAAQLRAARPVVSTGAGHAGRLVVVFQPHLYSRTRTFAVEFGRALAAADVVVVLDVYGAREDPIAGVSGEIVADAVPVGLGTGGSPAVHYLPDRATAARSVFGLLRPGDVVITMGAGDVTGIGPELLELLEER